jgi:hydroxymethylbilane synthase
MIERIIGTRTSNLALWQTRHIMALLAQAWSDVTCRTEPFVTQGDKTLDKPLPQIGGKGLFTLELEQALLDGRIHLAVHSLKDLPVEDSPGLTLGAIVGRADVRDVLIAANGRTLETLPRGAIVGTSSLRRQSQLRRQRPDLDVRSIRGNVETRIRKVHEGQYDATVLAAAGVTRLGLEEHVAEWLPLETMLPAPGQGALAVQCRADDDETLRLLAAIHQPEVAAAVTAERVFLHALGGGCATPVAAYGVWKDGRLQLIGYVGAVNGMTMVRVHSSGEDPEVLGQALAQEAIAEGAAEILDYG